MQQRKPHPQAQSIKPPVPRDRGAGRRDLMGGCALAMILALGAAHDAARAETLPSGGSIVSGSGAINAASKPSSARLANNGEMMPPCGVPSSVT